MCIAPPPPPQYTFTLSYTYCTIRCRTKQHFIHCINTTFTLFCAKTFPTYDNHSHFVQSWCWICTVSVINIKSGHCALCSHDLDEWQVATMLNLSRWSCIIPAQLYEPFIPSWRNHELGRKGSRTRRLSFELRFYICCFCIRCSH